MRRYWALSVAVVSAVSCASLSPTATAQTCTWDGSLSSRWLDLGPGPSFDSNWGCSVEDRRLPTSEDDVLIPFLPLSSTVVADGPAAQSTHDLVIEDGVTLNIEGGNFSGVSVFGDVLTNDGAIHVNSNNNAQVASLGIAGGATVDAVVDGEIVLHPRGRMFTASGTDSIVLGANHTIRGEGDLEARFTNNSTITAEDIDLVGDSELAITTGTGGGGSNGLSRTNNSIIQSSATSDLRLSVHLIQGAAGQVIADGGKISLSTSRITGGQLAAINGGSFESIDGLLRLEGIHLTSGSTLVKFNQSTGSTLTIQNGTFRNDGTVQIGMDATESTILNFDTSETVTGDGEIILLTENLGGVGSRIRAPGGIVATFGVDQTVRGVGAIEAEFVNNGTIVAEPRLGTILQIETASKPKTNNNVMRADTGATLRLRNTTITQDDANGQVFANDGLVEFNSGGTIVDGRLEAAGSGFFTVSSSGRITNVTNNAPITIPNGNNTLFVDDTLENNNAITVENVLRADADLAVTGTGEFVLPDPGLGSRLLVDDGVTVTQAGGHTTRGEGQLVGQGRDDSTFINQGRLEGESASDPLEVRTIRLEGAGVLDDVMIGFAATHAPGTSTGIVPLEGSYETAATAAIEIEIGGTTPGTEHDQLDSSGTVSLSTGTALDVVMLDLSNGYTPASGDQFDIIIASANDIVGTFNNSEVSLPEFGLGHQLTWEPIDYSDPRKVTLEIATAAAYDVDLDGDGDVDGFDFLLIQRTDPSLIPAWQFEYNRAADVSSVTSSVPEPTSGALLGALALVAASGGPSRSRFMRSR